VLSVAAVLIANAFWFGMISLFGRWLARRASRASGSDAHRLPASPAGGDPRPIE
jgi:hypothetical protein